MEVASDEPFYVCIAVDIFLREPITKSRLKNCRLRVNGSSATKNVQNGIQKIACPLSEAKTNFPHNTVGNYKNENRIRSHV